MQALIERLEHPGKLAQVVASDFGQVVVDSWRLPTSCRMVGFECIGLSTHTADHVAGFGGFCPAILIR